MRAAGPGTGWERLFWLVFEHSSNPIALVDEERNFLDVNDSWRAPVGPSREQLIGSPVDRTMKPDQRALAATEWQSFLSSGEYAARRSLLRPDGSEVRIDFAARLAVIGERRLAIYVTPAEGEPVRAAADSRSREPALSNREREVVTLIMLGHEKRLIAEELGISVETVRTHVRTRCRSWALTRGRSWSRSRSRAARRFTRAASMSTALTRASD